MNRLKTFLYRLKMGYRMFLRGYNSRSWESSEAYLDIAERLKICYNVFEEDENYVWCDSVDNGQMRKIREAIKLCEFIYMHDSMTNSVIEVMHKYRPDRRPTFDDLFPESKIIDDKLYGHFVRKAAEKDRKLYETRKKRLHKLLSKGLEIWNT